MKRRFPAILALLIAVWVVPGLAVLPVWPGSALLYFAVTFWLFRSTWRRLAATPHVRRVDVGRGVYR